MSKVHIFVHEIHVDSLLVPQIQKVHIWFLKFQIRNSLVLSSIFMFM